MRMKNGATSDIQDHSSLTSQSIIVWTRKTKSLLPSLYPPGQRPSWAGGKREEFPLFGKEGLGEIFEEHVFSIMDSLVKAAQKDLLEAKDLNELKALFKKWRRIGWKNVCKLWLEERTPEQLKGEGNLIREG
jgi:hypothetical protein